MLKSSAPSTNEANSNRAVFLDRDGTLIEERHYLGDPAGVSLVPGCIPALESLKAQGFALVLVTNQSGVGRGLITPEQVHAVNDRLEELLIEHGVRLDNILVCFHHPGDDCECRKPRAGMAVDASKSLEIDFSGSWVIGDKCSDVGLGNNIGARTILIRTHDVESGDEDCAATKVVDDLESAASYVRSVNSDDAALSK